MSEPTLLYVHDYGEWHIAPKLPSGAPHPVALCGTQHQMAKPHWASQQRFDGAALMLDDRPVHTECLIDYWLGATVTEAQQ